MYDRDALQRVSEVKSVTTAARPASFVSSQIAAADSLAGSTEAGASQEAARKAPDQPVDQAAIEQAVRQMNSYTQNLQRALQFRVDKDSGQTVVRVLDAKTDQVIRQIPTEEVLFIANKMRAAASVSTESPPGMLLQENV